MSFIEGDIDRPVVSQQLYNGQDLPPLAGPNQWIADDAPGLVRTRRASSHAAIHVLAAREMATKENREVTK